MVMIVVVVALAARLTQLVSADQVVSAVLLLSEAAASGFSKQMHRTIISCKLYLKLTIPSSTNDRFRNLYINEKNVSVALVFLWLGLGLTAQRVE